MPSNSYGFCVATTMNGCGSAYELPSTEIDVSHAEREAGESCYGPWKLINYLLDLVTCVTTFPVPLLSIAGMTIAAVATGLLLLLAIGALFAAGWATGTAALFAVLFILVGLQFAAMGLLAYFMLTNSLPFEGRTIDKILTSVIISSGRVKVNPSAIAG